MDSATLTAKSRRQVTLMVSLAIAIIFVSGLFQGTVPTIVSGVGAALALIGWVYSLITAARARQSHWVIMLAIGLLITLALAALGLITVSETNSPALAITQLAFLALAFITLSYSVMGGGDVIERSPTAFYGGWGLLSLVIGGTLVGGAIGTSVGSSAAYITALGFRLYIVAGVLGLIAWIIGLIVGLRTQAWGWFALILLLPCIGAFMFGLFGPTRQDVLMAQENARQRKAVGLN